MPIEVTAMTLDAARRFLLPLAVGALACAGGCAGKSNPPAARAARVAAPAEEYPLIVRLEGRHYSVTACSGPDGVVYTAHGRDGNLVVANATLDELRQRHPEIYQQILPGIAEKAEGRSAHDRTANDAEPDASIDGPVPMGRNDARSRRTLLMMDAAR